MRVHIAVLVMLLVTASAPARALELTVATFNVWGAGANDSRGPAATVAALRELDADVFALQEVRAESPDCTSQYCPPAGPGLANELAEALGYHVFEQSASNDALWANAILSRHPIVAALGDDLGVLVEIDGQRVAVLNVHLPDYPYQPYQFVGIEYGGAPMLHDEAAGIDAALAARGAAVDLLLDTARQISDVRLLVVCGDFNEPSHLDWTDRAARAGNHPMRVRFPASRKLAAAGLVDAYRAVRRDEVAFPGFTWTPSTTPEDRNEHHDRIDFIYLKGAEVRVVSAAVAGESPDSSDLVVNPWPSDHRALLVRLEF